MVNSLRINLVGSHVLTGPESHKKTPYILRTFLAGGSFGQVYSAIDEKSGAEVAVKLERYDAKFSQLHLEYGFYKRLGPDCPYAPAIIFLGQVVKSWTVLVMEMLGPSLKKVQELLGGSLSVPCTAAVGISLLRHLSDFHRQGLIFRDVKPDNFLVGLPTAARAHSIYLIDLGLAKNWRNEEDGNHIPFNENKQFMGTVAYVSLNMHKSSELSRRDDLECLLYMLVHLCTGTLPWFAGNPRVGNDLAKKIVCYGNCKSNMSIDEIISGMPAEFGIVLRMVRALGFDEKPEYEQYICLLNKVLTSRGFNSALSGSASDFCVCKAFDCTEKNVSNQFEIALKS